MSLGLPCTSMEAFYGIMRSNDSNGEPQTTRRNSTAMLAADENVSLQLSPRVKLLADDDFRRGERKVRKVAPSDTLTPADRYQELFQAVQMSRLFEDSKTFADCIPKAHSPNDILAAYRRERNLAGFDLQAFIIRHFTLPLIPTTDYVSDPNLTLRAHIDTLWNVLTRQPKAHPAYSSLLPVPNSYVVPGGRFMEMYYWDSYFTMLGLAASKRHVLLRNMALNFAYMIDTYGHIPNGNRTYYLSRSQPPVFALMVELFEGTGVKAVHHFLPQLLQEYAYWMDGAAELRVMEAHRRVVRLSEDVVLNRYWDDRDTPREEAYLEDITTAKRGSRPAHQVYRDLRAAAESGWDFSSRWLGHPDKLETICTTSILPVDLNCFLYKLEQKIADLAALEGNKELHCQFSESATRRQRAINQFMWDDKDGGFYDFDWEAKRMRTNFTAATVTPLFIPLASPEQAKRVASAVCARLLRAQGIATTEHRTDQQWDESNGWAPLQWMAIQGLANYGMQDIAQQIARRWLKTVAKLYQREGKLVEKYAMLEAHSSDPAGGGGGEYPLQDGFGWTNGVSRMLLQMYPDRVYSRCHVNI